MGIATVAVYSDADANARHVRLADEAVRIGPAPARESYLVGAAIVAAAKATGAEAIHPGYGFLSENDEFAEQCAAEGIVFVGPPPAAIRAMGSKSAAKTLMAKAGVPAHARLSRRRPGSGAARARGRQDRLPGADQGERRRRRQGHAPRRQGEDFAAALASCRREAKSAFGDDRVLVEQYVLKPRHIEIQVFGDTLGHCVLPVRARLLGAAAPPEGARGSAGAGDDGRAPRGDGPRPRSRRRRRSATSAPARSSSSPTPTAASTSWR